MKLAAFGLAACLAGTAFVVTGKQPYVADDIGAPIPDVSFSGTAGTMQGPSDGEAVGFDLLTADGRVISILVYVPAQEIRGTWRFGHPNSSEEGGSSAQISFVEHAVENAKPQYPNSVITSYERVSIPEGLLTVARVTEDAIEGRVDLTLASGQHVSAPFKVAFKSHGRFPEWQLSLGAVDARMIALYPNQAAIDAARLGALEQLHIAQQVGARKGETDAAVNASFDGLANHMRRLWRIAALLSAPPQR